MEESNCWVGRPDVCRCCLAASGTLDATATIITDSGTKEVLYQMFQECYSITLRLWGAGGGSGAVCAACAGQLRAAVRFKRQVLQAEARFTRYFTLEEYSASEESIKVPGSSSGVVYSKSKWKRLKAKMKKSLETTEAPPTKLTQASAPTNAEKNEITTREVFKRQETDFTEKSTEIKHQKQTIREFKPISSKKSDLTVMISRADNVQVDEDAAEVIGHRLGDVIERAVMEGVDGGSLSFADSGLLDGLFLVTAITKDAKDWLLSSDFGSYNGVALIPKQISRTKVSIFLPGNRKVPNDPLKLIKGQNNHRPDLRTHEWSLIQRETLPGGTRLIVGVPKGVIRDDPGYVRLNYQATQVQAKIMRSKNRIEAQTANNGMYWTEEEYINKELAERVFDDQDPQRNYADSCRSLPTDLFESCYPEVS